MWWCGTFSKAVLYCCIYQQTKLSGPSYFDTLYIHMYVVFTAPAAAVCCIYFCIYHMHGRVTVEEEENIRCTGEICNYCCCIQQQQQQRSLSLHACCWLGAPSTNINIALLCSSSSTIISESRRNPSNLGVSTRWHVTRQYGEIRKETQNERLLTLLPLPTSPYEFRGAA